MSAKAKLEETKPKHRPIPQHALRRAEEVRNHYRLTLPNACNYRDLFNEHAPEITAPLAPFLTRGDTIEVLDEAGSTFALLLLEEHVPSKIVSFVELYKVKLRGEAIDDTHGTGQWRAGWLGWERRYGVIRPNGGVARDGLRTREEADADAHDRNKPLFQRNTLG